MTTIREILRRHSGMRTEAINKINNECRFAVRDRLRELGFDGLVRRKSDGKIGKLIIDNDCYGIDFYPLKKNGLESSVRNGFVWNVEQEFEPYKE